MAELKTLVTGLVFGEQPRWHDGRLWFSDWGTQEVIAADLEDDLVCDMHRPDEKPRIVGNLFQIDPAFQTEWETVDRRRRAEASASVRAPLPYSPSVCG